MKKPSECPLFLEKEDLSRVVTSLFNAEFSSSLWHTDNKQKIAAAVSGVAKADWQRFVNKCLFFFDLEKDAPLAGHDSPTLDAVTEALCLRPLERLNFQTSGSTGAKKTIPFHLRAFASEAIAVAPLFSGLKRIVSVVPEHHLFGFSFSVILPKYLAIPVLRMAPLPTRAFVDSLRDGDLVVAFPRFWQALLSVVPHLHPEERRHVRIQGVSSTAPCPPGVWDGLLEHFLCAMTEIYGATETGAVGYRPSHNAPFTLLPLWERLDTEGKISLARRDEDGTEDLPQPVMDTLEWVEERQFFPLGRIDHAVQVGGVNVYPNEIAATIASHPDVKECAVRLMRPEEGVRLKAFIVPAEGITLSDCPVRFGASFRRWLRQQFSAPSCPKAFTFGQELPCNDMGKRADW